MLRYGEDCLEEKVCPPLYKLAPILVTLSVGRKEEASVMIPGLSLSLSQGVTKPIRGHKKRKKQEEG